MALRLVSLACEFTNRKYAQMATIDVHVRNELNAMKPAAENSPVGAHDRHERRRRDGLDATVDSLLRKNWWGFTWLNVCGIRKMEATG